MTLGSIVGTTVFFKIRGTPYLKSKRFRYPSKTTIVLTIKKFYPLKLYFLSDLNDLMRKEFPKAYTDLSYNLDKKIMFENEDSLFKE